MSGPLPDVEVYLGSPAGSVADLVRWAEGLPPGVGVTLGPSLLVGVGGPVVATIAADRPVFCRAPFEADRDEVAAAVRRLAGYGATWVAVAALSGIAAVEAAVAASGKARVAVDAGSHLSAPEASSVIGLSPGKLASKAAALAASTGAAGVMCQPAEIGVVAQVSAEVRAVALAQSESDVAEAKRRGAIAVLLPPGSEVPAESGA